MNDSTWDSKLDAPTPGGCRELDGSSEANARLPFHEENGEGVIENVASKVPKEPIMHINHTLNRKVCDVLDIIDNNFRKENLNSLIEVSKELVELAQEAKEALNDPFISVLDLEDEWLDTTSVGDVVFTPETMEGDVSLPTQDGLGNLQKEVEKTYPDCGEHKKQGRMPNVEKLKIDGEAIWKKKIMEMLKVGKGDTLPKDK